MAWSSWDCLCFWPPASDPAASFLLAGHKLRGRWSLIETRGENMWLLIKKKDDDADARRNPTSTENKSVLTGRTMHQIETDGASPDD